MAPSAIAEHTVVVKGDKKVEDNGMMRGKVEDEEKTPLEVSPERLCVLPCKSN
jgi:hypothetical protein